MKHLQNQNFRTEFKKRKYENITFQRIPRTNAERVFFIKLDSILKDLGLTVKASYNRIYSNQYVDKMKRFIEIKNPFVYHIQFNEIDHITTVGPNFEEPKNVGALNVKYNVVWSIFGNHYEANQLCDKLNEVQRLKVAYLRLSKDHYYKCRRIDQLENHISEILPLKAKNKFARINEFLRAGKRKFQ